MRAWLQRSGPTSEGDARGARSVAGWAAALALIGAVLAIDPAPFVEAERPAEPPQRTTAQLAAQDRCVEGALLFHDVRWAVACTRLAEHGDSDGHADCELPPAESDRLNRLLQQAEQRCMAEAAPQRRR